MDLGGESVNSTGWLWLLVILSVASVYVMIERILYFRTVGSADAGLRTRSRRTRGRG